MLMMENDFKVSGLGSWYDMDLSQVNLRSKAYEQPPSTSNIESRNAGTIQHLSQEIYRSRS
jgi:hypothetical protein